MITIQLLNWRILTEGPFTFLEMTHLSSHESNTANSIWWPWDADKRKWWCVQLVLHLTYISIDAVHSSDKHIFYSACNYLKVTPIVKANAAVHLKKKQQPIKTESYSDLVHKTAIWWWNQTLHLALAETACASWWLAAMYMKWGLISIEPDLRLMKSSSVSGCWQAMCW